MIDIVVPTYNRLWALQRVIPWYLRQALVDRVIVVDDCSTDGSQEWIRAISSQDNRVAGIHLPVTHGAAAARNRGADHASAPYVLFIDDDMQLQPEHALSVLFHELERCHGDIIAPLLIIGEHRPAAYTASKKPVQLNNRVTLERTPMQRLKKAFPQETTACAQACGIMLMRREVLFSVRYDESLGLTSYRDETDFQLKAIAQGFKLLVCPQVMLIDFEHPVDAYGGCRSATNVLSYELQACKNNWRILRRHSATIKEKLGIPYSMAVLQAAFIAEHLGMRLLCTSVVNMLRRWNMYG
jgi:glycosyltransferase involved in cell wall biosynthesis